MAATMKNYKVSCRGGLDLRSTSQELLQTPGSAAALENFECVSSGGYRRINGHTPYGDNPVPGVGQINGIHIFNDSILVSKGDAIYHSFDASTWVQINKEVTDANLATIQAAAEVPMNANTSKVRFADYTNGTAAGDYVVMMVNGLDEMMYFKITGDSHNNATYTFTYLDEGTTGAPAECKYVFSFKDQIYASGRDSDPSSVFVSALFTPDDWTGTNSLQVSTADTVTGLKPFRENMIVFCENSIFSLGGVAAGSSDLKPITKNIGCIASDSIQEVGGDLIYLAPDGLRTLAGTDRIDDVELSVVSSKIQSLINTLLDDINLVDISSTVLREKSQYRLYYPYKSALAETDRGIIGTLVYSPNGSLSWNWSETKAITARHVTEGLFNGQYISLMSTGSDGLLHQHDVGNLFNTSPIPAIFTTHEWDLGDSSVRKNLHRVKTLIKPEGNANINLRINSTGYTDETQYDPSVYFIGDLKVAAQYGTATYESDSQYGGLSYNTKMTNVEGSGFTFIANYTSDQASDTPYNLQGYDLDFTVAGKI